MRHENRNCLQWARGGIGFDGMNTKFGEWLCSDMATRVPRGGKSVGIVKSSSVFVDDHSMRGVGSLSSVSVLDTIVDVGVGAISKASLTLMCSSVSYVD